MQNSQKLHFLVFALLVGNFSNKHHYNLLKILRIFCFWYFYPKWLFPKLFVLKVDLCIKVVALKSLLYSSVRKEWKLYLWINSGTLQILAQYSKTTENHNICSKQKFLRILSSLQWFLFEIWILNEEVRRFCISMY